MFTFKTRKITVLSKRFQSDPVVLNRLGLPLRQTCKSHSVNERDWLMSHNVFDDIQQVIRVLIKEITMSVDNCIMHRFTRTTVQLIMKPGFWKIGHLHEHFPVYNKFTKLLRRHFRMQLWRSSHRSFDKWLRSLRNGISFTKTHNG